MNQEVTISFNEELLKMLKILNQTFDTAPLMIVDNGFALNNDGRNLVTITPSDILVAGKSFQDKFSNSNNVDYKTENSFTSFIEGIKDRLVRLNHLGVSYFCGGLEEARSNILQLSNEKGISLYEDSSSEVGQKWLFMGSKNNWRNPMFEIVLNEGEKVKHDFWRPHFQIDIDTDLQIEELRELINKYIGKDFVQWQIDIPDYGVPLVMGVLEEIGDSKIALGIGTDKRDSEYWIKNELRLL